MCDVQIKSAAVNRLRTLLCCVLGIMVFQHIFAAPVYGQVIQAERPEEELLILELHVNTHVRNYGLLGYLPKGAPINQALLPLSSLARALSFSAKVNPADGVASGWFYNEENVFRLDMEQKTVFVNGSEHALEEGVAEAHFEDIYVRAEVLEKWFGVNIEIDLSTLRILVTGSIPFPFEEELARKQRAKTYGEAPGSQVPVYTKDMQIPYEWVAPPSFVWQQTVQARRDDHSSSANTSFSIQSYGDILKFGSRFIMSGTTGTGDSESRISSAQGTFQRQDPSNTMLSALKAGRIAFGDVNFPDVPLIVGRKRGRGVVVSSDSSLRTSRSFGAETYNVDGDAPIGWDAELYRNGYFVAFQEVDETARYNFEDIELVRGYNLFQIVLYGPEGQKRTDTQRVIRGQEMLQEGELEYELAAGQPESDFLPIADNARTDSTFGGSARIAYGVRNFFTLAASAFTGADLTDTNDERISAFNASAVVSFKGVKTQAQIMRANEGRSAYDLKATSRVAGANVTVSHTEYNGFLPDDKDLKSSTGLDANRNFGKFSASVRAEKNKFIKEENEIKEDEVFLRANLSTRIKGVAISNALERTISDNEAQDDFEGELAVLTSVADWRVRGNLTYDLDEGVDDRIRLASLSGYTKIDRNQTLRVNASYDVPNHITSGDVRYTRQFDKYSIDFNLGGSSRNDVFGGVTFRTGFQPDFQGDYHMVSARDGGLGAVALKAYLDQNGNGEYDMGEKLLPNITFRSNRGLVDEQTNDDGTVFVNGLSEGLTRFEVDESSLPSIYIKPYEDYKDIIPRSGATATIYMGFEQLGEVDGFVYIADASSENGKKAVPGVELILSDIDTGEEVSSVSSEYDGYFVFPALPLGGYEIQALPAWDEKPAAPVRFELTNDKPILTDRNILLSHDAAPSKRAATTESVSEKHKDVQHIIHDEKKSVQTDGLDVATEEPLRGLFIHLSSMSSLLSAQKEQKRLWNTYADELKDIPLYIYKITVGDKVFYRIVGSVEKYDDGRAICDALIAKKAAGGCRLVEL